MPPAYSGLLLQQERKDPDLAETVQETTLPQGETIDFTLARPGFTQSSDHSPLTKPSTLTGERLSTQGDQHFQRF